MNNWDDPLVVTQPIRIFFDMEIGTKKNSIFRYGNRKLKKNLKNIKNE